MRGGTEWHQAKWVGEEALATFFMKHFLAYKEGKPYVPVILIRQIWSQEGIFFSYPAYQ